MIYSIENKNIVIIGGGKRCKALLEVVLSDAGQAQPPRILGVADTDMHAAGMQLARHHGIFTTSDYRDLVAIEELDLILELTSDKVMRKAIQSAKTPGVLLVDHHEARAILDHYQIMGKRNELVDKLRAKPGDLDYAVGLLEEFSSFAQHISSESNTYARETRERLIASQWSMEQILNGSTIPTFVLDKQHKVIHWNKACERLTGYNAQDMIETDHQWKPFRRTKKPTMADLVLDGISEDELWRLYGASWGKSMLIEGGYVVEEFFPHLGESGTWLFFTAAPIRTPDGEIAGAIETLWDRTPQKQAEAERERKNKDLSQKVEELVAKEQTMAQIISGSTIPTFVIDKDHQITHWNKAMEQLTGHSAQKMVGTRDAWIPFYDQERPTMADVILDQVDISQIMRLYGTKWRPSGLITGAYEAEVFFPDMGKTGKWLWFTAAPIKTPEGDLVGAIETIWDKTEDRQAEKEREQYTTELATFCSIYATLSRASGLEDRIKAAIEEVANIFSLEGICLYIQKPDGKFHLRYNYGFSDQLCHRTRVAGPDSMVARVAQSGKTDIADVFSCSGGEDVEALRQDSFQSVAHIPIGGRDRQALGVMCAGSQRKNHFGANEIRALELTANRIGVAIENALLQEDISRRAEFQARLINSSNDGIVASDDQWKVVIFNPAAESIFGYPAAEVIGQMDVRRLFPDAIQDAFAEVVAGANPEWTLPWQETTVVSRSNESIPVRFYGTVLREKYKMMGTVAYFHDLRQIKHLEHELVNAERLAAVGQTVAGMAHCVKNILHGLKGGSYMINIGLEKDKIDKFRSGWNMVQRNINRTADLVQDLLTYSKEREPEYEACVPNDIADDVCQLMAEVANENHVKIIRDFASDMGELVLDPRSLHRVLLNLVSNAIDACRDDPNLGKEHQVTVRTCLEPERFVRFDVSDNGSGMSDEVRSKLFSSFFSTKGVQGTGLGLLVTSKLIEEHQGTIQVESTLNVGTTFTIRLPLRRAQ
jgi:PAS domain S-box-containing protein